MTRRPFSLSEAETILAMAAYDALMDGESFFGVAGGWKEHFPNIDQPLDALVALLRSDEPLSADLRHALADTLDLKVDTPINLIRKRKRRPRLTTFFDWNEKSEKLFARYTDLKASPYDMNAGEALDKAADEVRVSLSEAQRMIAAAAADRRLKAAIKKAQATGKSPTELKAVYDNFERDGRPRGRKPNPK